MSLLQVLVVKNAQLEGDWNRWLRALELLVDEFVIVNDTRAAKRVLAECRGTVPVLIIDAFTSRADIPAACQSTDETVRFITEECDLPEHIFVVYGGFQIAVWTQIRSQVPAAVTVMSKAKLLVDAEVHLPEAVLSQTVSRRWSS